MDLYFLKYCTEVLKRIVTDFEDGSLLIEALVEKKEVCDLPPKHVHVPGRISRRD